MQRKQKGKKNSHSLAPNPLCQGLAGGSLPRSPAQSSERRSLALRPSVSSCPLHQSTVPGTIKPHRHYVII